MTVFSVAVLPIGVLILIGGVVALGLRSTANLRCRLRVDATECRAEGGSDRRIGRGPFVLLAALSLFEAALGVASPWPFALVIDYAVVGRALPSALVPLAALGRPGIAVISALAGVVLVGGLAVLGYAASSLSAALGEVLGAQLRHGLAIRVLAAPLEWLERARTGDLANRLTSDVGRVQEAVLAKPDVLIPRLVSVAGMAALMLTVAPSLGVIVLGAAPLLAFATVLRRRVLESSQRDARAAAGALAADANELIGNVRPIRAFGQEERMLEQFDRANRRAGASSTEASVVSARLAPVADLVLALALGAVLVVGYRMVAAGSITLGQLVVFATYLATIGDPVRSLTRLASTFARGAVSAKRVAEILDQPSIGMRPPSSALPDRPPTVRARDLRFAYGSTPVFSASFNVQAGELACVLGPSGCGKSTLLGLLTGLQAPSDGLLSVGGIEIERISHEDLHRLVTLVPQDHWLVSGSIEDNIRFSFPRASSEEVRFAGERAGVAEFADRLPQGWDTPVGEGGVLLSGGQRRRIAIARALIGSPRLVLLDEPTTGLDPTSAEQIKSLLRSLRGVHTVIIATHDGDIAAMADRLVVFHAGSFVEPPNPRPTAEGDTQFHPAFTLVP